MPPTPSSDLIPSTLRHPGATRFWTAVMLAGAGTGVAAAALTRLPEVVQRFVWNGSSRAHVLGPPTFSAIEPAAPILVRYMYTRDKKAFSAQVAKSQQASTARAQPLERLLMGAKHMALGYLKR
jgi:hypothetical protein